MIFVAIKQPRFSLSMGLLWLFLGIDDVQKKKKPTWEELHLVA
jgi:hypothetical protein